jgi:hypothetical protein
MRSDTELREKVLAELRWAQRLRDEDVAVASAIGIHAEHHAMRRALPTRTVTEIMNRAPATVRPGLHNWF